MRGQLRRLRDPLRGLVLELDRASAGPPRRGGRPRARRASRASWTPAAAGSTVARTAAAAGLLSSWVSPADSEPRASSRSRWAIVRCRAVNPWNSPLSRCWAIGNHSCMISRRTVGVELEERRRLGDPHGLVVDLRHEVAEVGVPRADVRPALGGPVDLDVVVDDPARHHQRAVEQHVEAGRVLALAVEPARLDAHHVAVLAQEVQPLVGERLEQEQRAQQLRRARRHPVGAAGRDGAPPVRPVLAVGALAAGHRCPFPLRRGPPRVTAAPGSGARASRPSRPRPRPTRPA